MIGMVRRHGATGLRPFAYTIATFTLYRPFEMVRDDLCYQNLPVTIVGIGGGVTYSTLGATHHAQEDVAIACAIPNMSVIAPCDPSEDRSGNALVRGAGARAGLPASRQGRRARLYRTGARSLGVRQVAPAARGPRRLHPLLWPDHEARHRSSPSDSTRPARASASFLSTRSSRSTSRALPTSSRSYQARRGDRGVRAERQPRHARQGDRLGPPARPAGSTPSRSRTRSSTATAATTTCSTPTDSASRKCRAVSALQ